MRFLKIWLLCLFLILGFGVVFGDDFQSPNDRYVAIWTQEPNNGLFEIKESGYLLIIKKDNQETIFDSKNKPFDKINPDGYVIKSTVKWLQNNLIYFSRANMGGNSSWKTSAEIYVCNPATGKIFCVKGFNPEFIKNRKIRYQYYEFPAVEHYSDMCDFRQKTKIKWKIENLSI